MAPWPPLRALIGPFFENVKNKLFISTKCFRGQASRQYKQQKKKKLLSKANYTGAPRVTTHSVLTRT